MAIVTKIPLYLSGSIAVAIGGLCNGYDTGAIGAQTEMIQFKEVIGHLSPTLLGFTVSLVMLGGAIPSVFAGYFADKFGRLRLIMVGALLLVLGTTLQAAANQLPMFMAGRALAGIGQGTYLSNVAVYICEIAPVKHRGTLAGLPQFMATAGVCVGYFTCYASVHLRSAMSWRAPFIIQALLGLILAGSCMVLPDSPRWLMLQGRRIDALSAIQRLGVTGEDAREVVEASQEQGPSLTMWQGLTLLFKRGYRSRTTLGLFMLGMIQLSGIDAVLYYAPTLFKQAGVPGQTSSFLASGLSAILMLAVTIPAFLFADRWGRRTATISGGILLGACMWLMGILYATGSVHPFGAARWVVIVCVFVFGLTYCATWGVIAKIYASEIQPTNTRAIANCVAQGLGFFTNFFVALITPILLAKSAFGAYFMFGAIITGTVTVFIMFMPETRGKSLESIQQAFQRPAVKNWRQFLGRGQEANGLRARATTTENSEVALAPIDQAAASGAFTSSHSVMPVIA